MNRTRVGLVLAALSLPAVVLAAPSDAVKRMGAAIGPLSGVTEYVPADDARLADAAKAIEAVGAQNDAGAAKALVSVLLAPFKSASVEVSIGNACHEALAGLTDAKARQTVLKVLKKGRKNPEVALALAEVVGAWGDPDAAEGLAALLESKSEQVVICAAHGLGKLGLKEGLGPLIEAFERWSDVGGEPVDAIGGALYDITGLGLTSPEDWKKWWKTAKRDWDPSQRGTGEGATSERPKHYQSESPPSMFQSLEVTSRRIVVIMDVSGSMHIRQYIEEPNEGPAPNTGSSSTTGDDEDGGGVSLGGPALPPGVTPGKPGYKPKPCTFHQCPGAKGTGPPCPSDENLPLWYSRLRRLARQTERLVEALNPKVKFNIIAYSTAAQTWRGNKLVEASGGNKQKAVQWIRGLQAGGATSADLALELAFTIPDADTFIFVTDGAPTNRSGKPHDPSKWRELLDHVKRLNKRRGVRIDVVAIAEGHTDFARGLAEENEGQYLVVD